MAIGTSLYVVEKAIWVVEKFKIKGTLTIGDTGYTFSGKEGLSDEYDICEVTASQTVLAVPGLFGPKNKPALRLSVPGHVDGVFAMDEDSISAAIKKVQTASSEEDLRRKEEQYVAASKKMDAITTSSEADEASSAFKRISAYKDAQQKAHQCDEMASDLRHKEQVYDEASTLLNRKLELKGADRLISMLQSLEQYRNAPQLLATAIEKRARIIEYMYNDACDKMSQAKVPAEAKAALAIFEQIPNSYKETSKKVFDGRKLITELERQDAISCKALALLNKATTVAEVDEAISLFNSIPHYHLVRTHIDQCEKRKSEFQKKIYDEATQKLANAKIPSDVDAAISLFKSIEKYRDAAQQINKCQAVKKSLEVKEADYKIAVNKLNAAKTISEYEEVSKLFSALAGYRDAKKQCENCNAQIKRLKEIEERARKEAAEKARLAAEQKAKVEALENAQSAPDDIALTKEKITAANRKALNLFLENPFRVLGLSRNANADDAQAVLDKFKKLERLKALGSYSSPFHLKHFTKPDRSAAVVQAAIGTLNDVKNRILWFSTPIGSAGWYISAYRELEKKLPGIDYDKYDVFLANYIFCILNDPLFANKAMWTSVFKQMTVFIKQGDKVASLFEGADKESGFAAVFEKRVSQPIVAMIEDAEIAGLKNLYVIVKGMDELETISKKLDSRLSKWFETETRSIDKEISELGDGENAPSSKISTAKRLYAELKKKVKPELTWAESSYPAKSVRLTMFQDEYRGTAWSLMGFLFKAGSKADARNIADDIEKYCNDEQKDILKYVIREVPRPRPKPVPPPHDTYDLGWQSPPYTYDDILIVEVDLGNIANVYLMEDSDYQDYLACRPFSYYGGRQTQTPVRIKIPSFGHWYVIIDNDGDSVAGLYSACRTRVI